MNKVALAGVLLIALFSCRNEKVQSVNRDIFVDSILINNRHVPSGIIPDEVDFEKVLVKIRFSTPLDTQDFNKNKVYFSLIDTFYTHRFSRDASTLYIEPKGIRSLTRYRFTFEAGPNGGMDFRDGFSFSFITRLDTTTKYPSISDDSLLTLVQKSTLRYFTEYAHPVSGMARERYGSGDIVTSGGTGFGIMAIISGIERGFLSRDDALSQMGTIVKFLSSADRFHGAYPHWLNGSTGKVYPHSTKDNGGDLVETAFLMQGLLTAREYFRDGSPEEKALADSITVLWESVEWNWYRNNRSTLFWHWSPEFNWEMNTAISGWNEALIVYILAASSPTHAITREVYDQGWARSGQYPMLNGDRFYGFKLPLGEDYGGPLFFAHYSFLGLDPRKLSDQYARYWDQNVAHSRINYSYCVDNPRLRRGFGRNSWGLTASDVPYGFSESSPLNDLGVIAPTAALSSFPYTPDESMRALRYFYYVLGDKLWGEFGFKDAYSLTALWFADSYIAVNQGPVVCMIENYRSGLLWNLFMKSEDVKRGLNNLGFTF